MCVFQQLFPVPLQASICDSELYPMMASNMNLISCSKDLFLTKWFQRTKALLRFAHLWCLGNSSIFFFAGQIVIFIFIAHSKKSPWTNPGEGSWEDSLHRLRQMLWTKVCGTIRFLLRKNLNFEGNFEKQHHFPSSFGFHQQKPQILPFHPGPASHLHQTNC